MTDNNAVSETHEWRKLSDFTVGDTIHRWGDDLPVTNINSTDGKIRLYYRDTDGQEKHIEGKASAEYISKKREQEA